MSESMEPEAHEAEPGSQRMTLPIPAFVGALAGAVIGAGIWAGLLIAFRFEMGIVAWGVGILVGMGAALGTGRNGFTGLLCGALALAAILGGKYLGVSHHRSAAVEQVVAENFGQATYDDLVAQSRALEEVESDRDLRGFLLEFDHSSASYADEVTDDEIATFESGSRPELEAIGKGELSYDAWREGREGVGRAIMEAALPSATALLMESVSALDLLFLALGVYSAVKFGSVPDTPMDPASRRARREARSARRPRRGTRDSRRSDDDDEGPGAAHGDTERDDDGEPTRT